MRPVNLWIKYSSFYRTAFIGFFCAILCVLLQNSSELFLYFNRPGTKFTAPENLVRTANLTNLPSGNYYISVGRPRGPCEIDLDGKKLDTTKELVGDNRSHLYLGTAFTVSEVEHPKQLNVICENEKGFAPGFTHSVVIMPYNTGKMLQIWREATTIYLAPFFCILLIFSVFITAGYKSLIRFKSDTLPFLIYGAVALLYSISLAHFTRLFFAPLTSSALHWLFRTFFGFSFYTIVAHYTRWRLWNVMICLLPIPLLVWTLTFNSNNFDSLYDMSFPIFSISTLFVLLQLYRDEFTSRSTILLRCVGFAWLLIQLNDTSVIFLNFGVYTGPAILPLMTAIVIIIRYVDLQRNEAIERSTSAVLQLISGPGSLENKLSSLGELVQRFTHYSRYSTYVDCFVLGMHDRPNERFVRLAEGGYGGKVVEKTIDFSEEHGKQMKLAIDSCKPVHSIGKIDHAWYSVVPLGSHAVLNLSDSFRSPAFMAFESHQFLVRSFQVLQIIDSYLKNFGSRMSYAFEVLRLLRGDGEWTEEIGCMFIDINGYDSGMMTHQDFYGKFITQTYLPALCQRVRKWAVKEGNSSGDSVYLVCVKDLMQDDCTISDGLYHTLVEILRFASEEGAQMCKSQGYSPIRLQIGVNAGLATITCDQFNARTSGNTVNEAARLQKAALPGSAYIHASLSAVWKERHDLLFGKETNEVVKTRNLIGHLVSLNRRRAA